MSAGYISGGPSSGGFERIVQQHRLVNQMRQAAGLPPIDLLSFIQQQGGTAAPIGPGTYPAGERPIDFGEYQRPVGPGDYIQGPQGGVGTYPTHTLEPGTPGYDRIMEMLGGLPPGRATGGAPVAAGAGLSPISGGAQPALPPMDTRLQQQMALLERIGASPSMGGSSLNWQPQQRQPRQSQGQSRRSGGDTFIFNYGGANTQNPAEAMLQRESRARRNRDNTSRAMRGSSAQNRTSQRTTSTSPFNRRRMNDLW